MPERCAPTTASAISPSAARAAIAASGGCAVPVEFRLQRFDLLVDPLPELCLALLVQVLACRLLCRALRIFGRRDLGFDVFDRATQHLAVQA